MHAHGPTREAWVDVWARSGAMQLTGRHDGPPLGPPAALLPGLAVVADRLAVDTEAIGRPVVIDGPSLLVARAHALGGRRLGTTSVGGATRLVPGPGGWIAVSLARPEDTELVPAWLETEVDESWPAIWRAVGTSPMVDLVDRGAALGLPVARLGERAAPHPTDDGLPITAHRLGDAAPTGDLTDIVVVELASLWAGPLCGSLLQQAGATVIKVESVGRPDGARRGPRPVFDLLNAGKRSVALDLSAGDGQRTLAALVERADVVIEGSRPRALAQMGVHATALLADGQLRVWASITGYGRTDPGASRVAFGDDAAVAGGLVVWDEVGPCFCADAVADPATGLVTATAVISGLRRGGRWLLDVTLSGVAAHLGGPTLPVPEGIVAAEPPPIDVAGPGPVLGADNEDVLAGILGS